MAYFCPSPRVRGGLSFGCDRAIDLPQAGRPVCSGAAADWSALERLYADDIQYRDPDTRLSSRAQVLEHLRGQVDAFAGFGYTISHTYSDSSDGAVVEWKMSGDYAGKPVSLDIVTAYDFLGGHIVS
jgi:SnoaL-like domain